MNSDLLKTGLIALILTFLVFCVTDCSCGRKRLCPGEVREHIYNPPYTSIYSSTDANGRTQLQTEYHDAEYKLLMVCRQPDHVVDVQVSMREYARYRDGDQLYVGERIGRWTSWIWSSWIDKMVRLDKHGAAEPTTY